MMKRMKIMKRKVHVKNLNTNIKKYSSQSIHMQLANIMNKILISMQIL